MSALFRLQPVVLLISVALVWLFPLCALGARFNIWGYKTAFSLLAGCALTAAIILALAGVGLISAIRQKNEKAKHRAMLVIFILVVPMGVLFSFAYKASQVPKIHDISTDLVNPPEFVHLAERAEELNSLEIKPEVIALQKQHYVGLVGLILPLSKDQALQRAAAVAKRLGWQNLMLDAEQGTLEAIDTSFWFGFKDDIVVRVMAQEPQQVKLDLRSVSRVGQSDLGKNAQRIEDFLKLFGDRSI